MTTKAPHKEEKEPTYRKLKPYAVLQYLMKYTDENHVAPAKDIVDYLENDCGIQSERRSIYKDIAEINAITLMAEEGCTIQEAEEMLQDDQDDEQKMIVYDPKQKGFYVRQRHCDPNDVRLLAECVYAAKFVTEGQAKRLVNAVCDLASVHQAERIQHNAFLVDRVKTNNKSVFNNISIINDAMSRKLGGQKHSPEKIKFKYLKHTIDDVTREVDRRKGDDYTVSPYALLISDGNYYMLAYDDKYKKLRTYRVDRMRNVRRTNIPRDGEEEFSQINMSNYTQRVFGMHSGTSSLVTIRFIPPLLDAAVERFGTKGAQYCMCDERHFSVTANVEVSDQFFGWILGFGKRAKILGPNDVVEKFKAYLDKVREMY